MRRILFGCLLLLGLLGWSLGSVAQEVETHDSSLLVKVGPGFDAANLPEGWTIEHAGASGWTKLVVDEPLREAAAKCHHIEGMAEVQYNPIIQIPPQPPQPQDILPEDDPLAGQLWGMEKIEAWTSGLPVESPSVVVGVIDTGVDLDHEDLASNIWTNPGEIPNNGIDDDGNGYVDDVHGWDFVSEGNDPDDDNNHGTHVSGTIGAVAHNGRGVAGVSWRVQIMPCKFLSATGGGTLADAIQAVDYAAANGARISNNSWGGQAPANHPGWLPLKEAIELAGTKGHLFVASAGNSNTNNDTASSVNLPASWNSPSILSVAASDPNDAKAGFSSYGLTSVDVAAPGVSILSSTIDDTYSSFSGTSMSAPHAVGLLALLAEQNTGWGHVEFKKHIMGTVDPISAWGPLVASGGRINVSRAFSEEPPPPPPPGDNQPPVAVDDSYQTKKNRPLLVNKVEDGVLGNDSDPDGDRLMAKFTRQPEHGSLEAFIPQGTFFYRPKQDFVGTDTFRYEANDGELATEAKAVIQVLGDEPPDNKPPVAEPDEYEVAQDTKLVVGADKGILSNDTDPDGDPMVVSMQGEVSHGRLSVNARTGAFTYLPDQGFSGTDEFFYKAVDPHNGRSDRTRVALTVTGDEGDWRERAIEKLQEVIELLQTN